MMQLVNGYQPHFRLASLVASSGMVNGVVRQVSEPAFENLTCRYDCGTCISTTSFSFPFVFILAFRAQWSVLLRIPKTCAIGSSALPSHQTMKQENVS
jgi:hypothetical protein